MISIGPLYSYNFYFLHIQINLIQSIYNIYNNITTPIQAEIYIMATLIFCVISLNISSHLFFPFDIFQSIYLELIIQFKLLRPRSYTNRGMAQFYQYTKARKQFGKPCNFADTKPMMTVLRPFQPKKKDEGYVLRNPNFIELDNLTELSIHKVNTLRVSTGDKGMFHREGGWPETIDPTEQQQYVRFMKKVDKDQVFAAQVKTLCELAEKCMLKNNQIDMYQQYFQNQQSQHVTENITLKTQMLLKDPPGICKRTVSEISWHSENPLKIAASYSINRFQQTPSKMKTCSYVWDLSNPNQPEVVLNAPAAVTNISFNHKLSDVIGGGCANGIVAIWDSRKGKDPTAMSHVQKSHFDPVTHFQWQMTKTGQQCVTVSTDGYAHFWDIRKLKEDRVQSLVIKDITATGEQITIGATTLENSPQTPTKYVIGTQQGTIIIANKKPKKQVQISTRLGHENKHLGPIYSITRNLQNPKIFMTMGDWSAKLWMDDLRTPLIKTKYHESYISDGCFAPTRVGAFFLTRKDGWLDVWDYYYKQNEVAFSHKISTAPLTSIKINYSGSGNQITGGKIAAIGDEDGTVTILQLCQSLYTLQKNERDIMTDIFTREMTKQKNLEALKRLQQLDKKRVPKDTTAAQKRIQERKAEQIKKVDQRFEILLKEIKEGKDLSPSKKDRSPNKAEKEEEEDS